MALSVTTATADWSRGGVRVCVRFRPQSALEAAEGGRPCIDYPSDEACTLGAHAFAFDRVLAPGASQADVYECAAREVVESVLAGFNGTVIAFGQTASGKTYTMEGPSLEDSPAARDGGGGGIVQRTVRSLFAGVAAAPPTVEFVLGVSMLEIYMERIRDLLAVEPEGREGGGGASRPPLAVHEERGGGVYIPGLTQEWASCEAEVLALLRRGAGRRSTNQTRMNELSSRSHSVVLVSVRQRERTTGTVKTGKLHLVDLAGSEKVGKSWATGTALDEAKTINKSLSALGNVINALTSAPPEPAAGADGADGADAAPPPAQHVPYRDSKLTRVLQESLGGNARTALVVTCSCSTFNAEETLSSLRFGQRAKRVRNKPVVNRELSALEYRAQLLAEQRQTRALSGELRLFRRLLAAAADGPGGERGEDGDAERAAEEAADGADGGAGGSAAEGLRALIERSGRERDGRLATEAEARRLRAALAEAEERAAGADAERAALAEASALAEAENEELLERLARAMADGERGARGAAEARAQLKAARKEGAGALAECAQLRAALEAAERAAAAPAVAAPAAEAAELGVQLEAARRESEGLLAGLREKIAANIELQIALDQQRALHRAALESVGAWGVYDSLEQLQGEYKALERQHEGLAAEHRSAQERLRLAHEGGSPSDNISDPTAKTLPASASN